MKGKFTILILSFLLITNRSVALLYIVRTACVPRAVFTPVPSTVNNICLQCVCVMTNISYCKPLIVQLSVICSAAAGVVVPLATVTAAPTIPAATATAGTGINPRDGSVPAPGVMTMPAGMAQVPPPPAAMMAMPAPAAMAMMTMRAPAAMAMMTMPAGMAQVPPPATGTVMMMPAAAAMMMMTMAAAGALPVPGMAMPGAGPPPPAAVTVPPGK